MHLNFLGILKRDKIMKLNCVLINHKVNLIETGLEDQVFT